MICYHGIFGKDCVFELSRCGLLRIKIWEDQLFEILWIYEVVYPEGGVAS